MQEQVGPVAVSRILSSQGGYINSGGGAGRNSRQRGRSGHRITPTVDTSPEEVLREQRQPVLEPRSPSSQNSDINLGRGTAQNSEQSGRSGRRSTPTGATEEVLRERPQPVLEPRSPSPKISDINLRRDAGRNSGQRGRSSHRSTPTRADTAPEVLREQRRTVLGPRLPSPQINDINLRREAGRNLGQRGGSGRRSTPTRADALTPPQKKYCENSANRSWNHVLPHPKSAI